MVHLHKKNLETLMKSRNEFTTRDEYDEYLRIYFAGLAMQGLLMNLMQHGHFGNSVHDPMVAEMAIICADELLKQLDNETTTKL